MLSFKKHEIGSLAPVPPLLRTGVEGINHRLLKYPYIVVVNVLDRRHKMMLLEQKGLEMIHLAINIYLPSVSHSKVC